MKTAIYIEDGTVQLVLTPESDFEKDSLKAMKDKHCDFGIFEGSFYDCRGGWIRQSAYYRPMGIEGGSLNESSLILRATEKSEA